MDKNIYFTKSNLNIDKNKIVINALEEQTVKKPMSLNQFAAAQLKAVSILRNLKDLDWNLLFRDYSGVKFYFKPEWAHNDKISLTFNLNSLCFYTKTKKSLISAFIENDICEIELIEKTLDQELAK